MDAYSGCWSELPLELLVLIFSRLEVVDFISAAAACRSWRELKSRWKDFLVRPKNQIPWLMLSSPPPFQGHSRYFHHLLPSSGTTREIRLPEIAGLFCIGSSLGFLISLDQATADLCAVNPVTGARIPLPPTSTFPDINAVSIYGFWLRFGKAILSPDPGFGGRPRTAAIIYSRNLAFARPGDGRWTLVANSHVDDILFHKKRLYAVNLRGALAVFDLGDPSHSLLLCEGLPSEVQPWHTKCYLVESPNGRDLYCVRRSVGLFRKTRYFWVYKLDELERKWIGVKSVGDLALFLGGSNHSLALSGTEHPSVKRNSIYFTDGHKVCSLNPQEINRDMGVFDLGDGSIQPLTSSDDICCFNWLPPIWFTPSLS